MKHVTFFVALVLLTVTVTSLGFAGKANVQTTVPTVSQAATRSVTDSDLPTGRAIKSSRSIDLSIQETRPIPIIATAASTNLTTGLAGTYSIPGDFANISSAVAVLHFLGVSGDVVFELGNASYTEMGPITFGNFPGAGSYNVKIQPAAGLAVTVNFVSTLTEGKGFAFNGAKNITIDGLNTGGASLTLQYASISGFPTSDAFGATVYITGVSEGISILNTHVKGQIDNAVWENQTDGRPAIFIYAPDTDGDWNKNITIDGCTITNATYAIKALLGAGGNLFSVDGLTITNNKIGGAFGNPVVIGGLYEVTANVVFANNVIDDVRYMQTYWYVGPTEYDEDWVFYAGVGFMYNFGQSTAFHFLLVDNGVFYNNVIRNIGTGDCAYGDGVLTYGTRVYSYNLGYAKTAIMYNNRFSALTNAGGGGQINAIRGPAGYLYHNSISLTGAAPAATTINGINGHSAVYNNAVSLDLTGATPTTVRAVVAGSNIDYNALYSTGAAISGTASVNAAALAGYNKNGTFGPINFDSDLHITTGPSAAENIGRAKTLLQPDIDGDVRDTTIAGIRDAGADEMLSDLALPWANDVMPLGLAYPGSSTPTGINVSPQVIVKNNTPASVGSFSVNVKIVDVTTATTEFDVTEVVTSMNPMEIKTIPLAGVWSVTVVGTKAITVTTSLSGDVQISNDVASASTVVSAPSAIAASKTYTFDTDAEGWTATTGPTATTDWKRKNSFAKLGSAYSGYSWVTERPNLISTYTEGAYANTQGYTTTYPGANLLTTPWLDISGMIGTDVYVSFVHSIRLEPDWDCAWMQYTVDGLNWKNLGTVNDPNGINWYSEAIYKHATPNPDAFDDATAMQYGLIPDADHLPFRWATNSRGLLAGGDDDGVPAGPDGWVYVQLHITPATYADIVHAPAIKFRYIGFSDAATAMDPGGFGFDNFYIGNSAPVLTGGTITGTIFRDANGNGVNDGEAPEANKDVKVYYYGVYVTTIQSDATGVYTFDLNANSGLPGDYQLEPVISGVAYTVPFGTSPKSTINHPSDGSAKVQDFGTFVGSVSGMVFEDVDNGGDKDAGEAGLGAFIVELRKDSDTGFLMGFDTSDAAGLYSILAPPYANYVIKQILKTNTRISMPATPFTYAVTVGTVSGDPSANLVNKDFGIFIFGQTKIEAYVDLNGDGIKGGADYDAITIGDGTISWDVFKGTTLIATDVLGDGLAAILHNLDAGDYSFVRATPPPTNWVKTSIPDEYNVSITTSRQATTFTTLYFKITNLQGNVIEDLNGNGSAQVGEGALVGWTVNLTKDTTTYSTTTNASGDYFFTNLGPGPWTITEVVPAGWTRTFGSFAAAYPFSSSYNAVNAGYNFGNFKNIAISGVLFRDRNNDGVKNAGEEGISGWDVTLAPGSTVPTGPNGEFTFTAGPLAASYGLSLNVLTGYSCTVPSGAAYTIAAVSGVDQINKDFGVFKGTDDTKYRTFTYEQLSGATEAKPIKYKLNKAIIGPPNTANLIDRLVNVKIGGTYAFQVGLSGQLNMGNKEKAYLKVTKQGDAFKSFSAKGALHTGAARGFDFTNKGGLMLKLWKSMGADKKNDALVAQLLTLQVNLAASLNGNTDATQNLGALIVSGTGPWGTDQTIDQIADYADGVMTNWEGIPFSVYTDLYNAVKMVNEAFASTTVGDTTTDGGWTSAKLKWVTTKTVFEVTGLKSAVVPAKNRINNDPYQLPEVYALGQNYPNPFNPTTSISFDLPNDAIVTLKIFNILGQEVATVLNRQEFSSGTEEVDFDASQLASGVYLYQVVAEEMNADGVGQTFTQVKKMMLMK